MTGRQTAAHPERRQRVMDSLTVVLGRIFEPERRIGADTRLVDELGLSSSVALYLLLELEEDLDVHIPVEGLYESDITTVGDLVDYVVERWEVG